MFYPCDYEVKLLKEQEIRERVARAEIDRLAQSIRPQPKNLISRSLRSLLHFVKHLRGSLGAPLDVSRTEIRSVRRQSNATQ